MLNHLPVIGVLFVALVLAVGLLWRNGGILRLGLAMLVLVALAAIPVFLSGEPAEESIEDVTGVSHASIESHEDAAKPAMIGLELLGLVALVALLRERGRGVPPRFAALLLIAVIALSSMPGPLRAAVISSASRRLRPRNSSSSYRNRK